MKTVDGAPQFVAFGNIEATTANKLLMDWAHGRRCVMCKFMSLNKKRCGIIGQIEEISLAIGKRISAETFSCNAFTPKNQENI